MILEGNERGHGAELARHLLNPRENDHVTVHSIEGFVASDLAGALAEAEAISGATQCRKYLFSLSLNPPADASVSVEAFAAAIADTEKKLGLVGQPRAVVFHEKEGRRHAHCVWSRIDSAEMKAITLRHYKRKLGDVSRELYRRHDWQMPEGFQEAEKRHLQNFSREEGGQAKRLKRDPKTQKAMFWACWERSDSRASFAAALRDEGYHLARGDRRGFVAVDADGKVWSLSRWCGVKPKELRARLGSELDLPSVEQVLASDVEPATTVQVGADAAFEQARSDLVRRQRKERTQLLEDQEARRAEAVRVQRKRIPKGLRAAFLRLSGRYQKILAKCETAILALESRDRDEQQRMIEVHLAERRALRTRLRRDGLRSDFHRSGNDRQLFRPKADPSRYSKAQVLRDPSRIVSAISDKKARFTRTDVLRELAKLIDDPLALASAANKAMASSQLVRLDVGGKPYFTTKDYQSAEKTLKRHASAMHATGGFGVSRSNRLASIATHNAQMKRAFGGKLSDEQCAALDHILSDRQFASVVGLAGAGKSTMLAAAMDAWRRQGVTVHGAALAGKAADGLESASGIQSRTLASLETSWENGHEPIGKGDVLVVDEAGMIGTRQLSRITVKMNEIGAKLVLIGDPDQLQPIEAGTPFRDLVDAHGAAQLTEIYRQGEAWQRLATRDLAAGHIGKAVDVYADQGALIQSEAAFEALVERYAMDATIGGTNKSRLAFAHRRADVHALNLAIREALRSETDPKTEVLLQTETGARAFSEGDRIVFDRNDRDLGVKNGMLGEVRNVSRSKITVALDGDASRLVTFDPKAYQSFDHGYAVTIHKSQGATVDQAYVLASRSMDRHLAYVAMTRHREDMRLYVRHDDCPKWAQTHLGYMRSRDHPRRSGPSMG